VLCSSRVGNQRIKRSFDDVANPHSGGEMEDDVTSSNEFVDDLSVENRVMNEANIVARLRKIGEMTGGKVVNDRHVMLEGDKSIDEM
jgi:hypothetical protein